MRLVLAMVAGLTVAAAGAGGAQAGACEALYESRSYAKALEACRAEAAAGDVAARSREATMLAEGYPGVPRDMAAALAAYRQADAGGHFPAKFELMLHHMNPGEGASYERALELMREIALHGTAEGEHGREQAIFAAERLANTHLRGIGVPPDEVEGLAWLYHARAIGDDSVDAVIAELEGRFDAAALGEAERRRRGWQ